MPPSPHRYAQVGNFRVEPPGLFRGRGEHPKMGLIKVCFRPLGSAGLLLLSAETLPNGTLHQKRIMPEDVIINIGKEATPPAPPAGHRWKAVVNKQDVSWLAGWKDSINTKDWKCVAPSSRAVRID